MSRTWFRFYEELNDFLPSAKRKKLIPFEFTGNPSVKDAIEAQGIPHVEVDLILVNSTSEDFAYKIHDGDTVSVYPVFESIDISSVTCLRKKPLRNLKFITDVHLGKLTKYLRLCGFDTYYRPDCSDKEIITIALTDKRVILTRDKELLKNRQITHGYWIRSQSPDKQLRELMIRYDLKNLVSLFSRCLECNGVLKLISKEEITERLLPKTRQYYQNFKMCPDCNRIYWDGSHYKRMKVQIENILRGSQ